MSFITFAIFALGSLTVALSSLAAFRFHQFKKRLGPSAKALSRAISWQLIGEMIIGLGTLVFAGAAHYEVLPDWGIEVQSTIRFVMFFATAVTTAHLLAVLKYLEGK